MVERRWTIWRWPASAFAHERGWQLAISGEDIPSAAEVRHLIPASDLDRAEEALREIARPGKKHSLHGFMARDRARAYCSDPFHAEQALEQSSTCPVCESDDPEMCDSQGYHHVHEGSGMRCCPDPFHEQVRGEDD